MYKRRYTIEATPATLARFASTVAAHATPSGAFIHRVSTDKNEEYYYVVLEADDDVHTQMRPARFTDSVVIR